jgi:multicomponent Na+:H+ antiporter subunit E
MPVYIVKIFRMFEFVFFYIIQVVQANFELAYYILSPHLKVTPGIIKIPIKLKHTQAILLLANSISMTPGSFTLDITDDKKYIYVHFLFLSNEEAAINEITNLENKIWKLFN